jgi:glycosyltransferase involved in cell wall biosynthesis
VTEGIAELTVSVVVCAYTERRWADLEAAIASAGAQSRPATETVLVIDHNPALAARARARFGRTGVRVVTNSRSRGLSGARNTALVHVAGDVVAFLDDDATADPHWLARLAAPYARVDVLAVGGPAHPVWPDGRRPGLLPAELYWVTGCSFTGQHAGTGLAEVRNLMGCNMSFRRSVFETIGGFDEGLGRLGDTPLGCEETELCIRLRQWFPDASILFEPLAMVDHRVGSERVTWAYLRRRCWAEGVSKAFVTATVGSGDGLSTERRYTTRVLPAAVRRELGAALRGLATGDLGRARRSMAGALAVPLALGAAAAGYMRGRAGTVGRGRRTTPGSR